MPPEVFYVLDFPTSRTVKHPACTDVRALSLARCVGEGPFQQHTCCDCIQKQFSVNVDR